MGVWAGWGAGVGGRGRVFFAPVALLVFTFSIQVVAFPLDDTAPAVVDVFPEPGAEGVSLGVATDASLAVSFSEPVALAAGAVELVCERSQVHALAVSGGPSSWVFVSDKPFLPGEGCVMTVFAERVSDLDADDPPDGLGSTYSWGFTATGAPVVINELDAITAGNVGEFVELYDGGRGNTDLSGLAVVFYRGDEASVYLAVGLDGRQTDAAGYFVLGDSGVARADLRLADGTLRDGPDAVAVYAAPKEAFPRNAPVSLENLLDATVYGPAGLELLALLNEGQAALDENARGTAESDSNQRCPNGGGQPRETVAFNQNSPTPGAANNCRYDAPPRVVEVVPRPGAADVALDATLSVTFSEPVVLDSLPFEIACTGTGLHAYNVNGGPVTFTITLREPMTNGETCANSVWADRVHDVDIDDPPDMLASTYTWTFQMVERVAENVVINEVDADTPGVDKGEFIELFDGGVGNTPLDGLNILLLNGGGDLSYLTISLDGLITDKDGFFLVGNAGVVGVGKVFSNGVLQNGPDAVALVAGNAAAFPNGTVASKVTPLDALVYGQAEQVDEELLTLLNAGQPQVDEAGRGDVEGHSNQRCPNGEGGARNTMGYKQNTPTPGAANDCVTDTAPKVTDFSPARGAQGVSPSTAIIVSFDEAVNVGSKWISIECATSGIHNYNSTGGSTQFTVTPTNMFAYGETCTVTINPDLITDQDSDDPPDNPTEKVTWSFSTGSEPADFVLINEIDADTPGTDTAEFIELFDGGVGNTSLSGLLIVLFNGNDDRSYQVVDLSGLKTDGNGYAVLGNKDVSGVGLVLPAGFMQNGPDAVALYMAAPGSFPNGTTLHTNGLLDAIVYGTSDPVDSGLLALLETGQPQVDEGGAGPSDQDSIGRCPNGEGGQRRSDTYRASPPTPGKANDCKTPEDAPPSVVSIDPTDGESHVPLDSSIRLRFNEAVVLGSGFYSIECQSSGRHTATVGGDPVEVLLEPNEPFFPGESCTVKLQSDKVWDADTDDPPDQMLQDFQSTFHTQLTTQAFVLINEIDADTAGSDTAEFIELYDGGNGETSLDNLVMVWWNGQSDAIYRVIDLSGQSTDSDGFLVIGNAGVDPDVTFGRGALQNGPDAVAIYAGNAADFTIGMPLTTAGLVDAVVYGSGAAPDEGLTPLLEPGEPQLDENSRGDREAHSLSRCPDGAGGPRRTTGYVANEPTPGQNNACAQVDSPPGVECVSPANDGQNVPLNASLVITFTEDVEVRAGWLELSCETSGDHALDVAGGPRVFTATPRERLAPEEQCTATVKAAAVHDSDAIDPPDGLVADFVWGFTTTSTDTPQPPVAGFLSNGPVWVGDVAVFTNTSSGPGPLIYAWDFGDGSAATGAANPTHLYGRMGTYMVKLTVTGPTGTDTASLVIVVRPRRLYLGVVVR